MKYFRAVIFAICIVASFGLYAEEEGTLGQDHLITAKQARQMGKEATREVTKVYLEKGIEAALNKADVLNAALWAIPYDRLSPEIRTHYRSYQTPEAMMRSEMWDEAQVRTGRSDPLWALEVFKWLDNHSLRYTGSRASRLSPLVINIYAEYFELGRMGEAHLLVQEMADALLRYGLNTETETLKDLGPWHPDFPLLRIRPFRIKQLDGSNNSLKGFYKYNYFATMGRIANLSVNEGKWQKAGELCLWVRAYADAFGKAVPNAKGNQGFDTRQSYSSNSLRLAFILELNGELNLAVEILDELISRNYRDYGYRSHYSALIYREFLLLQLGRSTPESIERVAQVISRHRKNRHANLIAISEQIGRYARILHYHGRTEEAWEVIHDQESELGGNSAGAFNLLRMAKIHLALKEGLYENVEQWLIESLEYVRSKGLKIHEPKLYELYAELEAARGNMAAAISLTGEAYRVNKALNLKHSAQENEVKLAIYRAALPESSLNISAKPKAAPSIPCDLQPEVMSSVSLTGKSAIGRFALSNPDDTDASGTMEIVGEVESAVYDSTSNTIALTISETNSSSHRKQITLNAQDQLIIEAHAKSPPLDPKQVTLKWISSGHPTVEATWTYSSSEIEVAKSFINASSVKDNPFYLVPIFHTLQRTAASGGGANNFRFIASEPMRVEVYSSDTGEPLYIDANGDGDLMDSGDQLFNDRDKNGYADITFDTNSENAAIEVYFRNIQPIEQSPVELRLELQVDGAWDTQCINQITFSSE